MEAAQAALTDLRNKEAEANAAIAAAEKQKADAEKKRADAVLFEISGLGCSASCLDPGYPRWRMYNKKKGIPMD